MMMMIIIIIKSAMISDVRKGKRTHSASWLMANVTAENTARAGWNNTRKTSHEHSDLNRISMTWQLNLHTQVNPVRTLIRSRNYDIEIHVLSKNYTIYNGPIHATINRSRPVQVVLFCENTSVIMFASNKHTGFISVCKFNTTGSTINFLNSV